MGVQELAVVGLVGSGVGAALSLPMVWPGRERTLDPRLLGGAMLLMSAIAALISARLAGFVPTSIAVEHAINLFGLCAFPLAVVYTRVACGAARAWAWAPALWMPAGASGQRRRSSAKFWLISSRTWVRMMIRSSGH